MSSPRLVLGLLVLPAFLCLQGCGLREQVRGWLRDDDLSVVAVQVGEKAYTKADLERFFDSRLSEFRDPADADKVKSNLLESFIEDRLLLCQAERHKVEANPQMLKAMVEKLAPRSGERQGSPDRSRDDELERNVAESLKMQQYLNDHLLKSISITDEECEAYYMAHLGDYVRNDVVHLREILLDDAVQARKVLDSLIKNRNKNFGELARTYSKAPSASDGGELGTFQRGDLPEEFEKVVFSLASGTISKIVRTQYGYHIFLVEEKISAHQQRLWEVKEQIRESLQQERERQLINKELAALAEQIPVVILRDKLDFTYNGTRFQSR